MRKPYHQPEGTCVTVTADGQEITPCVSSPAHGVTRDGRVFRIVRSHCGRAVPYEMKQQRLNSNMGYMCVGGSNWQGTRLVHRLVAEAYLPNPDGHPAVAHNNGNVMDNRVENLRWTTTQDNHMDKYAHGTAWLGTKHKMSKLTEDAVLKIRAGTLLFPEARDTFGISKGTFSYVKSGIGWTHIGGVHRKAARAAKATGGVHG